jgi:hypothetical protein
LVEHGWGVVVEVLKHEMAHQFVDEVLRIHDESAHGPAFRQVCEERGFDARAAGVPDRGSAREATPADGADAERARVIDRIVKLLALAESSNEHEAQAAALAAQKLMLKYNVEAVASGAVRTYTHRHLGHPSGRISEAERILALVLGEHFFVEAIWVPVWRPLEGRRGSVLEICGTPENVELAEYTHAFLSQTAERLWREHRKVHRIRGNANRRSFLAGVMTGFKDKLAREQVKHQEQGLVWVGDGELRSWFKQRHPRVRWTRHAGSHDSASFSEGREAGKTIVLHRGISHGPSGGPRLLPGR